jgi:hypothetical protein
VICPRCGASAVLFWLPGSWKGGICERCLTEGEDTAMAFLMHFGTVRHVSDGDAGKGEART